MSEPLIVRNGDSYNQQADCGTTEAETSQVPELDTREQLEADMERLIEDAMSYGWEQQPRISADAIDLLDRQVAITEREVKLRELYKFEENHRANIYATEEVNRKLNERIDELTAERELYRDNMLAEARRVDELTAELDELGEKNSRQRRQLGELQDAIRDRNEGVLKRQWQQRVDELEAGRDGLLEQRDHWFDEAVAIYRRFYPHEEYGIPQNIAGMVLAKIDELTAERDELQVDLKQAHIEWESERDYADQCEKRVEKLTAECDKLRKYGKHCFNNHVDYETEYLPSVKEFEAQIKDLETERDKWRARAERIDELTAERDELRERLDAMKAVLDKWVESIVGIELPDCPRTEFQPKDKDRRIAELTAERDKWKAKAEYQQEILDCDCRDIRDFQNEIDSLTAERDQLSRDLTAEHALVTQFEHDNERLEHANNTLKASIAGLKVTVENQRREIDAWRAGEYV